MALTSEEVRHAGFERGLWANDRELDVFARGKVQYGRR
jgi:hypothetical protein